MLRAYETILPHVKLTFRACILLNKPRKYINSIRNLLHFPHNQISKEMSLFYHLNRKTYNQLIGVKYEIRVGL